MNKRLRRKKLLDQGWFIEGVTKDLQYIYSSNSKINIKFALTIEDILHRFSPKLINCIKQYHQSQHIGINDIMLVDLKRFTTMSGVGEKTLQELKNLKLFIKTNGYVGD